MNSRRKALISCNDLTADKTKKTGLASIVDETSPEEEHETMDLIYNRPSPSPTDDLSKLLEKENVGNIFFCLIKLIYLVYFEQVCDVEMLNSPSKTPDLNSNLEIDPEVDDPLLPTHEVSSELGSDSQPQAVKISLSKLINQPENLKYDFILF